MALRYKLANAGGFTRGDTEWGPGKSHATDGQGDLCGRGWLHCYTDPTLAVMLNPIHAEFENPRLCEVECSGATKSDLGLKEGWSQMAFVRWIELPEVTKIQRVAFAILCAKQVYADQAWNRWADGWLGGKDRGLKTARDAHAAAATTARIIAEITRNARPGCALAKDVGAFSAAKAAWYAALAAEITVIGAIAETAEVALAAAKAVAWAAAAEQAVNKSLDLHALARTAMECR